ncbi:plastocyanin/azurin family copper-binding protein [Deinococcus sp.]|uniref:cupredoxin domain-containing protein n=1 Tax=Deinococcus sp. TaxID=47478 RepID=UPI0025DD3991|nr:plastocyanin/azurin family copper-binding protein [Deinococcus sp.]
MTVAPNRHTINRHTVNRRGTLAPRLGLSLTLLGAALAGSGQAAPAQTYSVQTYVFKHGELSTTDPIGAGFIKVSLLSPEKSESTLYVRGLTPNTAYMAHYHALGPKSGALFRTPCESNGPITLGFPAFKSDARGRAIVKLSADPATIAGGAGAYINIHRADDPGDIPLCAVVLKDGATTTPAASKGADDTMADMPGMASTAENTVTIIDNAFRFKSGGETLKIKVGDTVKWTYDGKVTHDINSLSAPSLKSPKLRRGDTYSYTFNKPGTFGFYCSFHEGMGGTIIVTAR